MLFLVIARKRLTTPHILDSWRRTEKAYQLSLRLLRVLTIPNAFPRAVLLVAALRQLLRMAKDLSWPPVPERISESFWEAVSKTVEIREQLTILSTLHLKHPHSNTRSTPIRAGNEISASFKVVEYRQTSTAFFRMEVAEGN